MTSLAMRSEATRTLDRIDELKVGTGMLEAYAFGRGDLSNGVTGLGLDYGHRISKGWSAFGRAEAGYSYGSQRGLGFDALAGLRRRGF